MKKYKVCVYAICKNEEKFVDRWVESMNEADSIYVLDTGSSDDSVSKLKNLGVNVETSIISPWRFDVARNKSLDLLPDDCDICVCTDLDEVFVSGWRDILEKEWSKNITQLKYNYIWSHDSDGKPLVNYYLSKIHSRHGFKWINPVHEVLECSLENNKSSICDKITLEHFPDLEKSRSSYLPLLELAVKEDPSNDRNMHYLGREYMYYKRYNEAIDTLIKHLSMRNATWKDERCASMRFIARCYKDLNRFDEANMWLEKAIIEAPYLRDPYMEMALLHYELENFYKVKSYCLKALNILKNKKSYINEQFCWNETPYDLLSIACFYLNEIDEAIFFLNKALEINPTDERLNNNLCLMQEKRTLLK